MQIRELAVPDAQAVAELSGELGYPATTALMEERIADALRVNDRAIYVACLEGAVVAWIDVFVVHHLQSGASAETGGLVVSSACRSKGIGARLLRRAEEWARERGIERIVVRSRSTREGAHRFYLREGYRMTKTSAVFTRDLC